MKDQFAIFIVTIFISSCSTTAPPKGTIPNVVAGHEIYINSPVDEVWKVLATNFEDIGQWSSSVLSSRCIGNDGPGERCSARYCEIDSLVFGHAKERILVSDKDKHILKYSLYEGVPGFVHNFTNTWKLIPEGNKTKVIASSQANATGIMGWMMGGIMEGATEDALAEMSHEVKHYIETGKPHPDKMKSLKKNNE